VRRDRLVRSRRAQLVSTRLTCVFTVSLVTTVPVPLLGAGSRESSIPDGGLVSAVSAHTG
jgi:hypothetical protein